jgi:phosphoribosylamine--glycine ligase
VTQFAYYSEGAASVSWARRLYDEGHDVLFYIPEKVSSKIGENIVPKTQNKEEWLEWGGRSTDTIYFFDATGSGELGDTLRKQGKHVIGAGKFMDKLEKDRVFGETLAKKVGITCPPAKSFNSISAVLAHLETDPQQESGDGGWAWKSDKYLGSDATIVAKDTEEVKEHLEHVKERFGDNVKCILQEKIKGVAVSTARWFDGRVFVGPFEGTIENKKFMNGDKGPATGCSLNTVWFYPDIPRVAYELKWMGLESEFRDNDAPPGLYDINAILDKEHAWFLEWTPRLGIDSELASQRGITSLSGFLEALVHGQNVDHFFKVDTAYHGVRISIPPYPNEFKELAELGDKNPAKGVRVRNYDGTWDKFFVNVGCAWDEKTGLYVVCPFGFIGACVTDSTSIKKGFEKIYKFLEKLSVQDLQYRTDAADVILKDVQNIMKYGWDLTPVLER